MEAINAFNTLGVSGENFNTKPLRELDVKKPYPLKEIQRLETKYGKAVRAIVTDGEARLGVYLPRRFVEHITDADLTAINEMTQSKFLVYLGPMPGRSGRWATEMVTIITDFNELAKLQNK